ncbi:DNA replication complex GINS family protein [Candidatus Pacearchaeota archaeon]|nr:DNA replication complex GINS family protein [Candidatus Pacearchaeota archaeon]
MITYNEIYEAARKERYSEQLQPIPKNFVLDVANYLKEKKDVSSNEEDVFSDVVIKAKKQLENALTLFKEIMLRRRKKILNLVLIATETGISKQDFENMFSFEKDLFEDLMRSVNHSDKKISEILNGKEEVKQNELIVFVEDVEEFVDLDGKKMSFEKGQIANIPKEIAKILIDGGKAELVEGESC